MPSTPKYNCSNNFSSPTQTRDFTLPNSETFIVPETLTPNSETLIVPETLPANSETLIVPETLPPRYEDSKKSKTFNKIMQLVPSDIPNCAEVHHSKISIGHLSPIHESGCIATHKPQSNTVKFSPLPYIFNSPNCEKSFSLDNDPQTTIEIDSPKDTSLLRSFISLGPICRICHDGDERERFISPCLCSGSMALVHKTCLEKWLSTANECKCELCNFLYPIKKRPKSFLQFIRENEDSSERRALISDVLCLCLLTPLILATTYLCVMGALHFTYEDTNLNQRPKYQLKPHNGWLMRGNFQANNNLSQLQDSYHISNVNRTNAKSKMYGGEIAGLIILAIILMIVYISWIVIGFKYHLRAWKIWRAANQEVTLEANKPLPQQ